MIAESGEEEAEGDSGSLFNICFSMSLPSLRAEHVLWWENGRVMLREEIRGWDWRHTEGNALLNLLIEKEPIVVAGICGQRRSIK